MTKEELDNLKPGDLIQNLGSGNAYTVTEIKDGHVIAVRTIEVSNPDEWTVVQKAIQS